MGVCDERSEIALFISYLGKFVGRLGQMERVARNSTYVGRRQIRLLLRWAQGYHARSWLAGPGYSSRGVSGATFCRCSCLGCGACGPIPDLHEKGLSHEKTQTRAGRHQRTLHHFGRGAAAAAGNRYRNHQATQEMPRSAGARLGDRADAVAGQPRPVLHCRRARVACGACPDHSENRCG